MSEKKTGLALLREPFAANQISKLPKPTKQQTDEVRANFQKGIRCALCGAWHHPNVVHLDYVGHAALTDRLLDCDPEWNWEPLAFDQDGQPLIKNNTMWIKLTVCGVSRLGFGDAGDKTGPNAIKEIIGDCLVRGTLITTRRGKIKIEDIKIGDYVPTRAGWKKVTDHWLSHKSAPVKKVLLSNGRVITGTPHHKVPVNKAEKRIDELRNGDIMYSFDERESQWRMTGKALQVKMLNLMAEFTGESQPIDRYIGKDTSWQQRHQETISIEIFTNFIMEKSQKTSMFITRMTTSTIMNIQPLLRLVRQNIQQYTPIHRQGLFASATSAGISIPLYSLDQNGADLPAKKEEGGKMGLLMSSLKILLKSKNLFAQNAAKISHRKSRGLSFVETSVVEVVDAGIGEVWNLSVEDVHEYVANGVLVNNCLRNAAMRFGAALDLWHKGDLHSDDEPKNNAPEQNKINYAEKLQSAISRRDLHIEWLAIPESEQKKYTAVKDAMFKKLAPVTQTGEQQ